MCAQSTDLDIENDGRAERMGETARQWPRSLSSSEKLVERTTKRKTRHHSRRDQIHWLVISYIKTIFLSEQELNNCEIDTREMVLQIDMEMEQHKLPLTDYSRGSGMLVTFYFYF